MKKSVLITGGNRGIGAATCEEFAKDEYNICINYFKNLNQAEMLKAKLEKEYNVKVLIIKADIKNENDVDEMVNNVIKEFGQIDVLVNNAGIAIDKEFKDRMIEDWELTLKTNLIGPFIVSRIVGKHMLARKTGKIINVSSTNGINSFFPTSIDYDASKAGLISLTHNLALEFAPYINVNAVAPGWVNTEMNKDLPKELIEEETKKIYKKRFAEPYEIAKVIKFLASDDADYINSEVIKIDGGY